MNLHARAILFGALVLALAALFLSLGFWQLGRLDERRTRNEVRLERLEMPPLRAGPLPDARRAAWRRMVATGRLDYAREVVLAPRSFGQGSPGVYLLTPLLLPDGGMVPVLRGSLPAPDGFHAPLERARPGHSRPVTVHGVALPLPSPSEDPAATPDTLHSAVGVHPVLARLERASLDRLLPYPVPGFYLRADSTTERIPSSDGVRLPARVSAAELDDGPHLLYALQWFAFAAITLVGGGIFLRGGGGSGPE